MVLRRMDAIEKISKRCNFYSYMVTLWGGFLALDT